MSSILTNNSSMVALETLRNINRNLETVQSEISTGKKVSNAKDNAAVWAVSTVMSSDVASFKAISDSLNLGSSTVGVARSASEKVVTTLEEIKTLIVQAQGENVDRAKYQTDIEEKIGLIEGYVSAAQFNGLNLLDGSSTDAVNVLASLDRASNGTVSASYISVDRQDLSVSGGGSNAVFGATADTSTTIIDNGGTNAGTAETVANGATQTIAIASVGDGYSYRVTLDDSAGANSLGTRSFEFVADSATSSEDVAEALSTQISNFLSATGDDNYTVSFSGSDISITNLSGDDLDITGAAAADGTAGVNAGGLGALASIDVTTNAGATSALTAIEGLMNKAIDAAAAFGSSQNRIAGQSEFVQTLVDSLTTGIGGLTDTDMEAASAKLQALQVQQQLGVQALSIANQAPQALLSLFR
ncbi:flagellin Laf1 [Hyphomonas neptunium ATCC 15444]|uniref:Flagellin n=2 Tax=Hyphomonas TaxID=85 RepID=Q0C5J8_HYPNA|nr:MULTISPECIES: flagellin [Hyphomonas]ABI77835.1 flagellin Laf1 [Hyphomonas neptunium ATCC 15444]KCZ95423.1 flagellin Laf1 [Hyphomonas hirschiana VP5]